MRYLIEPSVPWCLLDGRKAVTYSAEEEVYEPVSTETTVPPETEEEP